MTLQNVKDHNPAQRQDQHYNSRLKIQNRDSNGSQPASGARSSKGLGGISQAQIEVQQSTKVQIEMQQGTKFHNNFG